MFSRRIPQICKLARPKIYTAKFVPPRSSSRLESEMSTDKEQGPSKAEDKEAKTNVFKNDGSFLELFRKMQEEEAAKKLQEGVKNPEEEPNVSAPLLEEAPKPPPTLVGKRRGGRVLPTGQVKKQKSEAEAAQSSNKDAWSAYMAEVKKYQSTTCEEEGKNRPLVK